MNNSAIFGILILFGAVILMIALMSYKREKEYKIAMEKYERDMKAYNEAVALYGEPMPAAALAPVAPAVSAPASPAVPAAAAESAAAFEGEVMLSGVDEPTAAMIIAILCDELGKNPSTLRFKSITAL